MCGASRELAPSSRSRGVPRTQEGREDDDDAVAFRSSVVRTPNTRCVRRARMHGGRRSLVSDRARKGKWASFDRGHASARVPEQQPAERTPEDKATGARTVADNIDRQLELVHVGLAAMERAAASTDRASWNAAKHDVDVALAQLAHIAKRAPAVAEDAADPDVRTRIANAGRVLDEATALRARAPAAPAVRVPELSCGDDLLAALPPDHPVSPAGPLYASAELAVAKVIQQQFRSSDIAAFLAILDAHPEHEIARRFRRFGRERQRGLLKLFDLPKVKVPAREREATHRRTAASLQAQPGNAGSERRDHFEHAPSARGAVTELPAHALTQSASAPEAHAPDHDKTNGAPPERPPNQHGSTAAQRRPKLLMPEPGPRPASTLRIPDAAHPAWRDHDGEQLLQTSASVMPSKGTPLHDARWKPIAEVSERIHVEDDDGDVLQLEATYRLESRPPEVGEVPDVWVHSERRALLTLGSGEHAGATIVGQARIHLAPGQLPDPKAAIGMASFGASHWAQVYLAEAEQFVTLLGPGGRGSLVADAAGHDVFVYDEALRMLGGLRRVLKEQHIAGHGAQVAAMHDRAQQLLAGAARGQLVLQREIEAILNYHDPHPHRVEAVRFLASSMAGWLAENERAGREQTEDARRVQRALAELEQLLSDVEKVHPPKRNHLDDALGAPVRLAERTGKGIGELALTLVDAVVLDVDALGAVAGIGTFEYHPRSHLFRAVETTGSATTALVLVVNSVADEWSDAIERARNGDYRALTDVSADTLMMIEGAGTGGVVALTQAERLAAKLGRIATSAHTLARSGVQRAGMLAAQARSVAAVMAEVADAFAAQLRAAGMQMAAAGGGSGPRMGGLSAEAFAAAVKEARKALQAKLKKVAKETKEPPTGTKNADPGSMYDPYGDGDENYLDAADESYEQEYDGAKGDMDPQLEAERGMDVLHGNRLGIARPPRHHLFPQKEIEFFQERGFPGREIDNFCVEFQDPLAHDIVHGGKQALATKHWPEHEWSTALMRELRSQERKRGRKLTRPEILETMETVRARLRIQHLPILHFRRGR